MIMNVPNNRLNHRRQHDSLPMKTETVSVTCTKCQAVVQVPAGGKRLCSCGTCLAGESALAVEAQPFSLAPGDSEAWPKIEGDRSASERPNDGYRRIQRELPQASVGHGRVI